MKKIKFIWAILPISILMMGCGPSSDYAEETKTNPGEAAFEKNSKTVLAYLDSWESESIDYDKYFAKDYSAWGTAFADIDTTNLEQMIEWDNQMFKIYDFKIVNGPVNLLPGVNLETKEVDGSVRYYMEWAITRTATDSTEAKTANLRMYSAYVFNTDGKITLSLTYGDFGGLMGYLNSEE